jgi:hypothetical protein
MSTVVLSLDTKQWSVLLKSDIGLCGLMHKAIYHFKTYHHGRQSSS